MSEVAHRTVETNGIRVHLAEAGTGPLVVLCHGFPEFVVFVAPSASRIGRCRVSRGGARYARLWPNRSSRGDRPVHASAPGGRHGGPPRRSRRRAGGDRRPRLGGAGSLARRTSASRPLPGGDRSQRSLPAARAGTADHGHAARRQRDVLSALFSDPGCRRSRASARCRPHDPQHSLLDCGRSTSARGQCGVIRCGGHGAAETAGS